MNRFMLMSVASGIISSLSLPAVAQSWQLTGSLETAKTNISFPTIPPQLANVGMATLPFPVFDTTGCIVTDNESLARKNFHGDRYCLFEWEDLPEGLVANGYQVSGILKKAGVNKLSYKLSFFSGSSANKIVLTRGQASITALAPAAPVITSVKSIFDAGETAGLSVTNHNRDSKLWAMDVRTEVRPFIQTVALEGLGSCDVPIGETMCRIPIGGIVIGGESDMGSSDHKLNADAANGFFSTSNSSEPQIFAMNWDYRPADILGMLINAQPPGDNDTAEVAIDDVEFSIENNTARVAIKTPHFGKKGSWWKPKPILTLNPTTDSRAEITLDFEGDTGNFLQHSIKSNIEPKVLHPIGEAEIVDDAFIFTFDVSNVHDGAYVPKISVTDSYNNKAESELAKAVIDRNPPEIYVLQNGRPMVNGAPVYFLENLSVAAVDFFNSGGRILSVKLNDVELELLGDREFYKVLKGSNLGFKPNATYDLEITVLDLNNREYKQSFPIKYAPIEFSLKGTNIDYHSLVQRIQLDLTQKEGRFCPTYENLESLQARKFAYGEKHRCIVEWGELPDGLEGSYTRGVHSVTGHFAAEVSDQAVSYKVWMFDEAGNRVLAADNSATLNATSVDAPKLEILQRGALKDNFFPVSLEGEQFSMAIARGVNADIELTTDNGKEVTTVLTKQMRGIRSKASAYQSLKVPAGGLWEKDTFDISAKYRLAPELETKANVKTVYVPSRRIRSRIFTKDLRALDTIKQNLSMKLGVYDASTRDFAFDQETMGEWKVYLATPRHDREKRQTFYDPITEVQTFSGSGTDFEVDLSDVGYGSYQFVGVADLVSPVDGYKRRVLSNSSFYRVLKGGTVDGEIKSYRVANPVPFNVSVVFEPEENQDREALGDITWEISKDGTDNWEEMTEFSNSVRLRKRITEAAHYFVRATVTNKFSGETRTTDTLEILGYEIPDLDLSGPTALYEGEKGTFNLSDHDIAANDLLGKIEWSFDGETWEEGTNTLEVVGSGERMQVWSRMSYFDNEMAGKRRFDTVRRNLSVKKPAPVRISITPPRVAEVDHPIALNAIVRLATSQLQSDVVSEWILPDGTVVPGNELEYTPTEADAEDGHTNLKFRSWVAQLKDETFSQKDVSIRTWQYHMPEFRFDVNYRTRYAPVKAVGVVRKLENQPTPVNFTYDFQMFEGLEKGRESNERLNFVATKPGVHQFKVLIKDDRGNEKEMLHLLEVLPPPATKVELRSSTSSSYMRQPLDASVRSGVKLGHPDDRVAKYEWYLNGELLIGQNNSRVFVEDLKEGSHEIKVKVTSNFGIEQEESVTVDVVPNKAPKCELKHRQYGNSISVQSGCRDSDGRMATHNWFIDGEHVEVHANNISFASKKGKTVHVRVVGYDDSGDFDESSIEISVN